MRLRRHQPLRRLVSDYIYTAGPRMAIESCEQAASRLLMRAIHTGQIPRSNRLSRSIATAGGGRLTQRITFCRQQVPNSDCVLSDSLVGGPVTRMGPSVAGPQQKSSGPRLK